jgi:hypothetical protein
MINERKLTRLLAAARKEPAPVPSEDLAVNVMRAIRPGRPAERPGTPSLVDQLNLWFPRLAWVAVAIIVLGIATDWGLTVAGVPGLGDGLARISAQWLLPADGF